MALRFHLHTDLAPPAAGLATGRGPAVGAVGTLRKGKNLVIARRDNEIIVAFKGQADSIRPEDVVMNDDLPNLGRDSHADGSPSWVDPLDTRQFSLAGSLVNGGLWYWNPGHGSLRYAGDWVELLGDDIASLPDDPAEWLPRLHPDDRPKLEALLLAPITGPENTLIENIRVRHHDGTFRSCQVRARIVNDTSNREAVVIGSVIENLTASLSDPLTGLANRTVLMEHLNNALERYRRNSEVTFAVLFLDLNNFKVTNDSLGHHIGDLLLIEMARRLQFCVRGSDTVARLGGDEFVVLIEGLENRRQLEVVVNRITRYTDSTFILDGFKVQSSASIGVVSDMRPYTDTAQILRDADIAMYHAKENRLAHTFFDRDMFERAVRRQRLEIDLRQALERLEFHLVYQPIVDLVRETVTGYEALLRWNHPHDGPIQPETFIRIAEETGLIVTLGEWVLYEVCRTAARLRSDAAIHRDAYLSVNISSVQLSRPNFTRQVVKILKETGVPARHLVLEITESDIMQDSARAISVLTQLKDIGIRIAVDDFGTGYSSLSYIHSLPLDMLKIDGSFVRRLESDPKSVEIVRTFVHLARSLGLTTISEGVETAAQASILRSLSCTHGQGFHFARPTLLD